MKKIISIEIWKFYHSKKNLFLISLLFAYMAVFLFVNHQKDDEYKSYRLNLLGASLIESEMMVVASKEDYDLNYSDYTSNKLQFWQKERRLRMEILANYRFYSLDNVATILQLEREQTTNQIYGIKSGYLELNDSMIAPELEKRERLLLYYNYILARNIIPLESPYQIDGYQFIYKIISGIIPFGLLIFVLLLQLDFYFIDFDSGCYKLLYTSPFSRSKIYLSKVLTSFFLTFLNIGIVIFVTWIFVIIYKGSGDGCFPISVSNGSGNSEIVSIQLVITYGVGLLIALIFLMNGFIIWISVIIDSASFTINSSAFLLLLTYFFSIVEDKSILLSIWPFSYYPITSKIIELGIEKIFFISLMLILITFILCINSYSIFQQKDLIDGRD